jgi:hypothetical protein
MNLWKQNVQKLILILENKDVVIVDMFSLQDGIRALLTVHCSFLKAYDHSRVSSHL